MRKKYVGAGLAPINANLRAQGGDGATSDRKGRDGVNPSTTQRHLDVAHGTSPRRGVDVGLAPSRPLRSLGSHAANRAVKVAPMAACPHPRPYESSTPRGVSILQTISRCRCVVDGFTPSRPLRSPAPPAKFRPTGLAPTLLAICLLAILTVIIAACSSTGSGNNPNTVHMSASTFGPSSITIKKGESLTLVSDTSSVHIIENGTWDNNGTARPNIEQGAPKVDVQMNGGDSKTFGPFNTAGTFQLYCTVHPGMNLTVIVK